MSTIVNGAPMVNYLATNDQSTVQLPSVPEDRPTHLAKIYTYAKRGPSGGQLVNGASMANMYHADSFDLTKPWATHATVLANIINSQGNSIMMERLMPADAGPLASIRISLDLLAGQVPEYQRNSDGSYALDTNGQLQVTGQTVAGFTAKWVATAVPLDNSNQSTFGLGTQGPGDQTANSTQSVRYPIMDLQAPYFGADGNNFGIRLWADTVSSNTPIDGRLLTSLKIYPFRAAFVYRPDASSTPSIQQTNEAEQYIDFTFRPASMDPNTDQQLYVGDTLIQSYQNLDDPNLPPAYGPFGAMHVYDSQIATVLGLVYAAEQPFFSSDFGDFTGTGGAAAEKYLFNLLTGTSSTGIPYVSYVVNTSAGNATRWSQNSTVYAMGGSDGTMNEALFASLVSEAVAAYADPSSQLQDTAKYPESIIYDSGFPLQTKKDLTQFISQRKDTFCVLATHDVLGPELTASQDSSIGIALHTALALSPESDHYGTAVMRGMVVPASGRLLQSQYTKRLPLSLEVARKAAAYMGAGNGVWKPGFGFDAAPLNQVTLFTDVSAPFTPATVRNSDWDIGIVRAQYYSRRTLFFPAFKTVYDDDTSVLNSFFTAMAIVELEKVGAAAWREFSGESSLSDQQLIERVNKFITDNTKGRFDGRFVIVPDTYFTAADKARGYSFSININIYAPNMRTVATLSVTAQRLSSLPTSA